MTSGQNWSQLALPDEMSETVVRPSSNSFFCGQCKGRDGISSWFANMKIKVTKCEIRCAALLRNSFIFQDNSPSSELEKIRSDSGCCSDIDSATFAKYMDYSDPLKGFRSRFQYPKKSELPLGDALDFPVPTSSYVKFLQSCRATLEMKSAFTCAATRWASSRRRPTRT